MRFQWHPDHPPPPVEEHSKAKLNVLRSYLRAYFDRLRLNVNPHREVFKLDLVNGFAGGGTFQDGDEIVSGTPLIMLEEAEAASAALLSSFGPAIPAVLCGFCIYRDTSPRGT